MFPYSNYSASFMPFDTISSQMYQNSDFNNAFASLGNYYYLPHPSYFQSNINFGPYLQSTLLTDESSGNLRAFQTEELGKNDRNSSEKNHFSPTIEQKIIYESQQKAKSKSIQKNGRQLQMLSCPGSSKQKKQKFQSKYNEQQYSVEEQIKKKTDEQLHLYLKYRRKNTESNIVNRIYSFLTSEFKNKQELTKLKLTEVQKQTYLKYLLIVVDAWKGPVKRQLLYSLMNVTESLPAFKVLHKLHESEKKMSLEEFGYLNRILIRTYLSKIACVSVITSKKMKKNVWRQHLQKIRELNEYFSNFKNSFPEIFGG